MPPTGNDWLALTTEETLEPEIAICDPHHHFWVHRPEPADYQQYLLPDLAGDVNSGHNVHSTVFIEVRCEYRTDGPDEMKPVGEVEYVQTIADASASGSHGPTKAAAAIIGHADLKLGEGVRPVLEAMQAASPNRFRGVRHSVGWDESRELANREIKGALGTDGYRAGAKVLAGMGLILENSLYFHQASELADFARALPELTIVLNHIGGLVRVGPYANRDEYVLPEWRKGIELMAKAPNIVLKLGGVGQTRFAYGWDERETPVGSEELAETLGPLMNHCIEQFGPERCMFESNYPVDKISYSYNVLFNAFKRLSKSYSATDRANLFHGTAARVYNIND
ncbi:MAG: amidohydrolase [SAR202 cluster bacterium]|nr:amidohydrolase [Chloroflexota bacterium]MAQ54418.1 amidohydrolase [Chloroflexota bacterium]MQG78353.1 amidohydrolase [SAR202 cluster bacterium]|tara:strand:- start:6231 stop:7247 length:1017 start_codon:yes stop_codon:yes gene_type:complete